MDGKYGLGPTPGSVMRALADRHKQLRKDKGYSQAEMAKRSGVSLGSLKRFEQSGQISLINLIRLMNLLGRLDDFRTVMERKFDPKEAAKLFTSSTGEG
ncbi:helix-turn-helix domain-containing protein [Lewinella sp. 4G2]|uniref:helix-turn-helix domain-containing protein n=1 Tax=Lewinella sp. 4G2 TaxID=1803372 RepID=UPI0007B465FC|nr:helix-turn-helix transcriptional regulator [Lewinella sp. 4G2]OAV44024.1 transcriptional regulator [Lewinella sp. 4G2]